MPQTNWMSYTGNQATASAGASLPPCTPQWNLTLWPWTDLPNQTISIGWKQTVPGAEFAHHVTTTAEAADYAPSIVLRVLCHALMNCLPEEGLPALYETLIDFHGLYKNRTIHALPSSPTLASVPVQVGRVFTTQAFDVSED
jgi:hypothetical protein